MNRKTFFMTLMLAALMLGIVGCAGGGEPTVDVQRAVVADRTVEGARVEVTLQIDNPTDHALPVRAVDYRITVAEAGTFAMTDQPAIALPPNGQQTLILPAAFANGDTDWVGRRVDVTGSLHYQPPGQIRELLTEYRFPLPSASFSATGALRESD